MWYIIYEVPSGFILFVLVFLMAITDSAGEWILDNIGVVSAIVYGTETIMGIRRCISYKRNCISLWITAPATMVSMLFSSSYLLLILSELAGMASGGIMGIFGLLLAAPLAIISCVACKAPGAFVNILASENEVDTSLVILDAVITVALCMFCRWFYGYI